MKEVRVFYNSLFLQNRTFKQFVNLTENVFLLFDTAIANELSHCPFLNIPLCAYFSLHGTCRNPYNTKYPPGGSSSGPAAAVAAGTFVLT